MKKLIAKIRKADRRRLAIVLAVVSVFGLINWGAAKMAGWLVDNGQSTHSAASSGYAFGFLMAFVLTDWMRRSDKFLTGKFAPKAAAKPETPTN